jgi:hypothetical protein
MTERTTTTAGPGYVSWVLALLVNLFFVYLWCVFGAAAAGNGNTSARRFLIASLCAGAVPLVGSVAFAIAGKLRLAIASSFATFPLLIAAIWLV